MQERGLEIEQRDMTIKKLHGTISSKEKEKHDVEASMLKMKDE